MSLSLQRQDIINCLSDTIISFEEKALKIFAYQSVQNTLYLNFLTYTHRSGLEPKTIQEIPFLPITLFKTNAIQTSEWNAERIFKSSGTTQMSRSQHYIRSLGWYYANTERIWEDHFGPLSDYEFVSLLPNYHENPDSSLLTMVSHFMKHSRNAKEDYFLDDYESLYARIVASKNDKVKLVLFGVSFALLEYCEGHAHHNLENVIVVETGGMKKYKKEITRSDLHQKLKDCFQGAAVYSEYGMSECLSQLYTSHDSSTEFICNNHMRILISDPTDPYHFLPMGRSGRINIIDLANVDSIAFIATDDIGRQKSMDRVEVLGRLSNAELRGCNYLI